jgi:hypothetical protein
MLCVDIVKIIVADLNIFELYQFMIIDKYICNILIDNFKKKLKDCNFFLTTYQSHKYQDIIRNIIFKSGDRMISIDISREGLIISDKTGNFCIKLSKNIFKSFNCENSMKFDINIYRLGKISDNLSNYDELYIYKELNDNIINILVINKFDKYLKAKYKIKL